MRLHFESDLDFQLAAVRAITDLFRGQEVCRSTFTVARDTGMAQQAFTDDGIGVGNRLHLIDEDLLRNLPVSRQRPSTAPGADCQRRAGTLCRAPFKAAPTEL